MPNRSKPPRDNAVRPHRLLAELTQAQLAERVGVSRQTIVAVESGGYAPSVYLALALAEQLGATVEALFATTAADRPTVAPSRGGTRDR
jgi:putative transcriptional regulator